MRPDFGVLGPVTAWDADGHAIALKGPRHRSVLARLIVARGRVVPVLRLVDDLWTDPPADAVGAVRTFVAALRRALEPDRPPRTPARLLVTEGPGYALRAATDAVDAWRFEQTVADAAALPPKEVAVRLEEALGRWRGPAYAEFAEQPWARAESRRLAELRLHAVELRAEALMSLGLADRAAADLHAHAAEHPWRENAWRLLALALYRTGQQADALDVLRRARALLAEQLGVDPGPRLRTLETDILRQADHLDQARDRLGREPDRFGQRPDRVGRARDRLGQPSDRLGQEEDQRDPLGQEQDPLGRGLDHPAHESDHPAHEPDNPAGRVWEQVAAAYDRTVAPDARARLESTTGLLRSLAVTGGSGLLAAREHRVAAIAAAEELGDAELTARVIGAYDVPAIWTRVDDPEQAARVVAAAERTLTALHALGQGQGQGQGEGQGHGHEAARARLLATIALESRGTPHTRRTPHTHGTALIHGTALTRGAALTRDTPRAGGTPHTPSTPPADATAHARASQAARQAEEIARRLDDPVLLAFALNATFMQCFDRTGLAPRRDEIGAELVALSARNGLANFEILGHLVRLQARSALGDFTTADRHAAAADALAVRHERPLVGVFTGWYAALRLDVTGQAPATEVEAAYRSAATLLHDAGMPGLTEGLLPLALLCLRLRHAQPLHADADADTHADADTDWGPYAPWAHPLLLLEQGHHAEATEALHTTPDPPRDLLQEALWCLTARAALALGDRPSMARAHTALTPAANQLAGAGSGLLTLGPVSAHLADLADALGKHA
ncbi:AfsR/SARP family transcriptional regulator [Streptomyces sp. HD]|uniref:AfsR/SARP family transcriptional regulator n=1 Tax=Streptomyces sp. HD TaxID=3020892 RepID=UPI00232D79CC|nr:BTAD domain-containing putative transcriptional regulator [Streptomyces sp. HD]MDC0771390.1 BTAD domain-containing putative transcriptional regulator [Streptomyces sp. HD]